jgi:SsrA-binding protein
MQARRAAERARTGGDRVVATNRRARHDFDILDTLECGLVLTGSEVKSLREGRAQIAEAYARVDGGELWLFQVHVPPWAFAHGVGAHDPDRKRKLLIHRHELERWQHRAATQQLTLIPLSLYFRDGRAKVELGLAKGRRLHDRREAIKERDAQRDIARTARNIEKYG